MSEQDKSFIEAFKKQVINVAVIYGFAMVFTAIGFYYTTNNALSRAAQERADAKIERIELKAANEKINATIDMLNERKINKDDYVREVSEMKQLLRDLNIKIDKLKK